MNLNNIAIITARMDSKRLPGKMLMDIHGQPMLWYVIQRAQMIQNINDVIVATTNDDIAIVNWCYKNGVDCYRGSENDILDRLYGASKNQNCGIVVRIWGSCPLFDPQVADILLTVMHQQSVEYVYNVGWPKGQACAVMTTEKLERDWNNVKDPKDREWYHEYCKKDGFAVTNTEDLSDINWDVDTEEDLEFVRKVLAPIYFKVGSRQYAKSITHPRLEVVNRNDDFTLLKLS